MMYLEVLDGDKTLKVSVEFKHRRLVGVKTDLLSKALGRPAKNKQKPFVIDATAGLCRDSMHLIALGCRVVAIERNEKLFRAFSGLRQPSNFNLIHAEAVTWLKQLSNQAGSEPDRLRPDIVYLDPMFPEKKKSAAASKETRLLQLLEPPPTQEDERQLLLAALNVAQFRVIVKRPKHAPWLAGQKPSHSLIGKSVRYDVYVTTGAAHKGGETRDLSSS